MHTVIGQVCSRTRTDRSTVRYLNDSDTQYCHVWNNYLNLIIKHDKSFIIRSDPSKPAKILASGQISNADCSRSELCLVFESSSQCCAFACCLVTCSQTTQVRFLELVRDCFQVSRYVPQRMQEPLNAFLPTVAFLQPIFAHRSNIFCPRD